MTERADKTEKNPLFLISPIKHSSLLECHYEKNTERERMKK